MRRIYATLIALLMGCASPSVKDPIENVVSLSKKDQQKLESIDDKVLSNFNAETQQLIRRSPFYVAKLKPSKALKGKVPAGLYRGLNMTRYLDDDYFAFSPGPEVTAFHETIHFLDITCKMVDRPAFSAAFNRLDENHVLRIFVNTALDEYDPKHTNMLAEKIAYTAQFWKYCNINIPDDIKRAYSRIMDDDANLISKRN